MRIQFHQLQSSLARSLAPVYLICGDEPLQLGEAALAVRQAARDQGFEERELLEQDAAFDWARLAAASRELSLFSARRIIELRLGGGAIGREGSEALRAYCADPSPDNLLLILAPDLGYKELKTKWAQEVERAGVLLQVRQLEGARLASWVEQRLRGRGLVPDQGVAAMLAERSEGNLLAAAQEVEKLALLYGEGPLDRDRLTRAISDSARYDLYDLPDAALAGDRARVQRILGGLAAEGTAPALVLWVLTRELRMLSQAAFGARRGERALIAALDQHRVWESRRRPVRQALGRLPLALLYGLLQSCARVDRQVKGMDPGDPWTGLARIADALAGGMMTGRIC
jgi:DNA polymerase-3 subunit delta